MSRAQNVSGVKLDLMEFVGVERARVATKRYPDAEVAKQRLPK